MDNIQFTILIYYLYTQLFRTIFLKIRLVLEISRDIATVKPLQYWMTIVYLFYYTITLSIRTVSFLYSDQLKDTVELFTYVVVVAVVVEALRAPLSPFFPWGGGPWLLQQ